MALIDWSDKLSVQIAQFDDEHKKLVTMINSLHDAMKSGKGREHLAKSLNDLTEYTLRHFANEERLMQQYNYPAYKEHKAVHDAFIRDVIEFKKMHEQQTLQAGQLLKNLQAWLVNHIVDVDKRYSAFLGNALKK